MRKKFTAVLAANATLADALANRLLLNSPDSEIVFGTAESPPVCTMSIVAGTDGCTLKVCGLLLTLSSASVRSALNACGLMKP